MITAVVTLILMTASALVAAMLVQIRESRVRWREWAPVQRRYYRQFRRADRKAGAAELQEMQDRVARARATGPVGQAEPAEDGAPPIEPSPAAPLPVVLPRDRGDGAIRIDEHARIIIECDADGPPWPQPRPRTGQIGAVGGCTGQTPAGLPRLGAHPYALPPGRIPPNIARHLDRQAEEAAARERLRALAGRCGQRVAEIAETLAPAERPLGVVDLGPADAQGRTLAERLIP
jgi:hypothetical protein